SGLFICPHWKRAVTLPNWLPEPADEPRNWACPDSTSAFRITLYPPSARIGSAVSGGIIGAMPTMPDIRPGPKTLDVVLVPVMKLELLTASWLSAVAVTGATGMNVLS